MGVQIRVCVGPVEMSGWCCGVVAALVTVVEVFAAPAPRRPVGHPGAYGVLLTSGVPGVYYEFPEGLWCLVFVAGGRLVFAAGPLRVPGCCCTVAGVRTSHLLRRDLPHGGRGA